MSRTYRYNSERERTFHKPKRRAFLRCVSGKRPFETAQAAHLRIGEIQVQGDTRHDITKDIFIFHCFTIFKLFIFLNFLTNLFAMLTQSSNVLFFFFGYFTGFMF